MDNNSNSIFNLQYYTFEQNRDLINEAVKYIVSLKDPQKIFQDYKAHKAFNYLYTLTRYQFFVEGTNLIMTNEFLVLMINLMEYFSTICSSMKHENLNKNPEHNLEALQLAMFHDIVLINNHILVQSTGHRIVLFQKGGLKAMSTILQNPEFEKNFNNEELFIRMVININWMSKQADMFKSEWLESGISNILINLAEKYRKCKMPAYMAFANICTDKQIDTLSSIDEIILDLAEYIKKAATAIIKSQDLVRRKQEFYEDDEKQSQTYEVYVLPQDQYNPPYSITGILLTLYRLSVNNTIKQDVYFKHNVKEHLKVIILKGSDIEKKYSLQLLAQLCFDDNVIKDVQKDVELINYINEIAFSKSVQMKSLQKICQQIIWSINALNEANAQRVMSSKSKKVTSEKQIMISYNSGSRDLCLRIKSELEKANFKVWIDVNEIHGSSLEAMARAVESSDIILMCVTEKYRQSINCQAEAQYAFKLKKKIIPVIMQKGYDNVDGWLGIIMGDKIFINFMKYEFEEAFKRLLNEVKLNLAVHLPTVLAKTIEDPKKVTVNPTTSSSQTPNNIEISQWNEAKVKEWFQKKVIPKAIFDALKPCDGKILYQLHKMQSDAPQFFYDSLSKTSKANLRELLAFAYNLDELFSSQS